MPLSHLLVLTALLISPLVGLQAAEAPAVVFDARAYGAIGDDATDNTAAFSRCLAAVVAAEIGRASCRERVCLYV